MSQQPSVMSGTTPQTWAIVVWALNIASFFTATLTGIVALIIAYVKRGDLAGTPFESHMTSAIRTFWITLFVSILGILLALSSISGNLLGLLFGFLVLGLLTLWNLFRVIRGFIYALDGKPIADPAGWM
jgi:uncharacterized membrane protein